MASSFFLRGGTFLLNAGGALAYDSTCCCSNPCTGSDCSLCNTGTTCKTIRIQTGTLSYTSSKCDCSVLDNATFDLSQTGGNPCVFSLVIQNTATCITFQWTACLSNVGGHLILDISLSCTTGRGNNQAIWNADLGTVIPTNCQTAISSLSVPYQAGTINDNGCGILATQTLFDAVGTFGCCGGDLGADPNLTVTLLG